MMTFEGWDNREQVEALAAELKTVGPELEITGYMYHLNRKHVDYAETEFPEKGNRNVMRQLEKLGWSRIIRTKAGGRGYWIAMRKAVPDEGTD